MAMQLTHRIRLESYREHLTDLQLAELHTDDIAEQPTAEMPVVIPVVIPDLPPEHVREWARAQLDDYARRFGGYKEPAPVTKPQLPLDAEYRPYLKIRNPYEDTQELVDAAVKKFIEMEGTRPAIILLSALRYLEFGRIEQFWYPQERGMDAIPFGFAYGQYIDYDILVLGKKEFNAN